MRIAYLHNLSASVADPWNCDKVFVDVPKSRRVERTALIDGGGLRAGDTLVVSALSQLGHGRESEMVQKRIAALGAEVEVIPVAKPPTEKRKGWLVPGDDQKQRICPLWQSTQPASYVLGRAADIMGQTVDRNWLNRHCGTRSQ